MDCLLKELAKAGAIHADLAAAFDASANPYMLLTPDLRYAGMNQAYLDVVGGARDDLLGRPVFEAFDSGPGESAAQNVRQLKESFERVLRTGNPDHIAVIEYAMPVRDAAGVVTFENRFWSATHTPIRDDDGAIRYILQHTTDISELENLRRQVADRRNRGASALDAMIGGSVLKRATDVQAANRLLQTERNQLVEMFMQAPGFVAVLTGPDHVFQMHNLAYGQLIGHREITGKHIREALPELEGQGYFEFLDEVFATGETYEGRESRVALQRTPGSPLETVFLNFVYQPIRDDGGRVAGIFVQGYEVTDNVLAAERQKLMIDELNHRVKNTLATVQSIAMQTARSHADPATFAESFQSRLLALSHTHNLLTRSHWEGAELHDVLDHETQAHGTHRVLLNGPVVALEPASALALGMIVHELATNAAKYGALSVPDGRVVVDWSLSDQTDRMLTLNWREEGGPAVAAPSRRGFGSRLVERSVRHDLAGTIDTDYRIEGFTAEITVPLDRGQAA